MRHRGGGFSERGFAPVLCLRRRSNRSRGRCHHRRPGAFLQAGVNAFQRSPHVRNHQDRRKSHDREDKADAKTDQRTGHTSLKIPDRRGDDQQHPKRDFRKDIVGSDDDPDHEHSPAGWTGPGKGQTRPIPLDGATAKRGMDHISVVSVWPGCAAAYGGACSGAGRFR